MSLCIVVPYRDREDQLTQFIPEINKYLPHAKIVVAEQADAKPFNRGKLFNISFLESEYTHYCFHDVDMIPVNVNYSERKGVTQLASSKIQIVDYLGGVTMFDREIFKYIGGYHNDYFHRAEDNCLMFNLKRLGIKVLNRFGIFNNLSHFRNQPEFIPELWEKAKIKREIQDQLSVCSYEIIDKKEYITHTHLRVIL